MLFGCDLAAFVRAFAAGFRAAFAMFAVVLVAFRRARVADFGAEPADLCVELRAAAHEGGSQPAQICAVDAESGAFGYLAEAFVATVLAFLRATHAGFDTGLVFLMCHFVFPFVGDPRSARIGFVFPRL